MRELGAVVTPNLVNTPTHPGSGATAIAKRDRSGVFAVLLFSSRYLYGGARCTNPSLKGGGSGGGMPRQLISVSSVSRAITI